MRPIILIIAFVAALMAQEPIFTTEPAIKPIEVEQLSDGTTRLRIHFNYLNSSKRSIRTRGIDGRYTIPFPLPEKWDLLEAKGYIQYTSSILLLKDLSAGVIIFNDQVIKQFKLLDHLQTGVTFRIDPFAFKTQNKLTFETIMHYTLHCEDGTHSTLWTQIDLAKSYLELIVRPKPIPETVSAIATHMFDQKQYHVTPVNFVTPDGPEGTSDKMIRNYAMFTAAAANLLRYRLANFDVSEHFSNHHHNVLITDRARAKEMISDLLGDLYLKENGPVFSMFFNTPGCDAWLNKGNFAQVQPSDFGVKIVTDGAYWGKSLKLDHGKILLKQLPTSSLDSLTVSFWYKPGKAEKEVLFGFDNYALVRVKDTIGFNTHNHDLYGSRMALKPDRWYMITASFVNGHIDQNRLFIDGKPLRLRQIFGHPDEEHAYFSNEAALGGTPGDDRFNGSGMYDQLYIFDHALSGSEVKKLHRIAMLHRKKWLSDSLYIDDKVSHDINVLQNPNDVSKAIIVIAPEDNNYDRVLYGLFKSDLATYTRQGLDILKTVIPSPAAAYSSSNFLKPGKRIYFSELGYKTELLKGWYPDRINLKFNLYPDDYFDAKDTIKTHLHYVFPTVIREDSVLNIFLNDRFARQIDILKSAQESDVDLAADLLFDFADKGKLPAYLLNRGTNDMRFELSLIPLKKGECEVFNQENLVATIMDDSYFKLPKAKKWVEMPYLEYVRDAQYPYSIYPDLQDTVIYLGDKSAKTIGSALDFVFVLSEALQSYPYYLQVSSQLDKKEQNKNIVVFGTIHDKPIQELSKTMPIVFNQQLLTKTYPLIKRFVDKFDILDTDRLKLYRYKTVMDEKNFVDGTLIVQLARSPFNGDKVVQMFTASSPLCLKKGIESIYRYENRHLIAGDLVLYNYPKEEGIAYNIKDKYIISHLNWLDTLALQVSAYPMRYLLAVLIGLIVLTMLLRAFLRLFKREHHPDA